MGGFQEEYIYVCVCACACGTQLYTQNNNMFWNWSSCSSMIYLLIKPAAMLLYVGKLYNVVIGTCTCTLYVPSLDTGFLGRVGVPDCILSFSSRVTILPWMSNEWVGTILTETTLQANATMTIHGALLLHNRERLLQKSYFWAILVKLKP